MSNLDSLIKNVLHRDGSGGGETLVVASHIQQLCLWMVRQGLRFYPLQDDTQESRKKKIESVLNYNKLDLYYKGIVTLFLCTGSVLWYLRPTGSEAYEIHWFRGGKPEDSETEYKAYYKPGGRELEEVIIRYSYEDYSPNAYGSGLSYYPSPASTGSSIFGNKRWVRLRIRADQITEEKFTAIPSLLPQEYQSINGYMAPQAAPIEQKVVINSLGFIPCIESPNHPLRPGDAGHGEFMWLREQIEAEGAMRAAMLDNVFLFGNPSLVTTRPKQQILEAYTEMDMTRPSWSSQQGYYSAAHPSTRKDDPWQRGNRYGSGESWGSRRSARVAKIIGGVMPEERFGYIFPDPINGDQWRFVQEYRENLHEALGGIDPLGMKSGMTFGEVKSLYGKVAATALDKARSLWTYGLAKLLEMMLWIEEQLWISSYKVYLYNSHPKAKQWQKAYPDGNIPVDVILQDFSEIQQLVTPPGVVGLAPYGDRTIKWKWTGPVFEDSPRDKLDLSIGVRNYQELGVGSLQSLEYLFPEKDPKELKNLLSSGIPFRMVNAVTGSIGTLLQLQQQLMGTADPMNPTLPLAARIDLTPLIEHQVNALAKEISYGQEFDNADNTSSPIQPGSVGVPGSINSGSIAPATSVPTGIPNTGNGSNATSVRNASSTNGAGTPVPQPGINSSGYAAGLQSPIAGGYSSTPGTNGTGLSDWQNPIPSVGGSILGPGTPGYAASNGTIPSTQYGSPATSGFVSGIPYDIATSPSLQSVYFPTAVPESNTSTGRKSVRPKRER